MSRQSRHDMLRLNTIFPDARLNGWIVGNSKCSAMVQHCWTIEEIKENNDLGLIAGKGFHSNEGLPRKTSAFLIFLQWPILPYHLS